MSVFTSSQFASAAAEGTDWRDTAKTVFEKLQDVQTTDAPFNFGFLYVSDALAENAESILNLFKSVLEIEDWVGGVGIGICANGESFIDTPAISAMVGRFDEGDFAIFPPVNGDEPQDHSAFQEWMKTRDPMLVIAHGDPMTDEEPEQNLRAVEDLCPGFMVGGLTSSRGAHAQFAGRYFEGAMCGAAFSSTLPIASTLSQGCKAIADTHTITSADDHTIYEIDGKKALEVFEQDLRLMTIKKIDMDPDEIMLDAAEIPEELQSVFKGEVHAALPISESDQNDYLVRNIMAIDHDEGTITIAQPVVNGERIMFVHRDHKTVEEDLSATLVALRRRVERDHGSFNPKGALYVSCAARAFNEFEGHNTEMGLIRDIIGDVPLTGFYAGGEINKGQLYGYTGILTLFL